MDPLTSHILWLRMWRMGRAARLRRERRIAEQAEVGPSHVRNARLAGQPPSPSRQRPAHHAPEAEADLPEWLVEGAPEWFLELMRVTELRWEMAARERAAVLAARRDGASWDRISALLGGKPSGEQLRRRYRDQTQ